MFRHVREGTLRQCEYVHAGELRVYQTPGFASTKTTGLSWLACIWIAAPALAVLPLALVGVAQMATRPDYALFPVAVIFAGWFATKRSARLGTLVAGPLPSTWFMGAILIGLSGVSIFALQRISLLCVLCAVVTIGWRLGHWPLVRAWAPPLACTVWFIPAPMGFHELAVRTLQGWAVVASHHILVAADVLHAIRGHLIALPGRTLFVSEACSGTKLLLILGALSCFGCVITRSHALLMALVQATTIGWVVVLNITRIVVIVLALQVGIDLAEGWPHCLLGLGLIPIGIILIIGTGALLAWITKRWEKPTPQDAHRAPTVWMPLQQAGWPAWLGVSCGALFLFQMAMAGLVIFRELPAWRAGTHLPLLQSAMPERMAGWNRISGPMLQESPEMLPLGVRSQQWKYANATKVALISMDDHFPGWHPLHDCYGFMGWHQKELNEESGALGPLIVASYESGPQRHGFLVYGLRSRSGEWIGRPGVVRRYGIALINHLKSVYSSQNIGETESPTRQVQVFIESRRALNDDEQRDVVSLFESARQNLDACLWPGGFP